MKPKTARSSKEQPVYNSPTEKHIDDHVVSCVQKMLVEIDQQKSLQKYENKIKELEDEIKILLTEDSSTKLKFERLKLKQEEELAEQQIAQREQLALNLNDLKERISNAEDNLNFCQNKHKQVLESNPNAFDVDTEIIYQKTYETIDGLRMFVKSVFVTLKNILFDNYSLYEVKEQLEIQVAAKATTIEELKEKIINLNT